MSGSTTLRAGRGVAVGWSGRWARGCSLALLTAVSMLLGSWHVAVVAADDVAVRVDRGTAPPIEGLLRSIDREAVALWHDGRETSLSLAEVRVVSRVGEPSRSSAGGAAVEVTGNGGLMIGGDDLVWDGGQAAVIRGAERIILPIERIGRAAWRLSARDGATDWESAVPAEPSSDLVAVSRGDGFDLVECAITGITPDAVGVMLDGDRIPVKRSKVLGLIWMRPTPKEATPPLVRIALAGGRVGGSSLAWRDGELVVDGGIRVPGSLVESIDFAAGRSVALADLDLEASASEPSFPELAAVEGFAAFVAPRVVRPGDGPPAWLMRPTASGTWRIPAGGRRFHGRLVAGATASAATDAVEVVIRADAAEVWRRQLAAGEQAAVDLDLSGARRLVIEVGLVDGGIGFPVRFDDAAFEK